MANEKNTEILEETKALENGKENGDKTVGKNEDTSKKESYEKVDDVEGNEDDLSEADFMDLDSIEPTHDELVIEEQEAE